MSRRKATRRRPRSIYSKRDLEALWLVNTFPHDLPPECRSLLEDAMKHEKKTPPPFTPRDVTHQFDGPIETPPPTEADNDLNKVQPREFVTKDAGQTTTVIGSSDGIHGSFQGEAQS